jgi:hypothetical protein
MWDKITHVNRRGNDALIGNADYIANCTYEEEPKC